MDKISKIKAYLENQKVEYRLGKSAEAKYRMEAYTELLDFINSLQEEPELSPIEREVVDGWTIRINRKRVPITLKGDTKHKFRNEFHTMWQIVGEMQFAHVAKAIMEHLCLHFAAWGAYNLKGIGNINEEEKTKMDIKEEPVSEELEKEIQRHLKDCLDVKFPTTDIESIKKDVEFTARHFAKWQKEQFEKNRLAHCDALTKEQAQMESDFVTKHLKENNRTPTFIDAIKYGMKLQKEQMMKDAIDVEVKVDAGGYPYIDKTIELYDYDKDVPLAKAGEKVKVIIMKEE